MRSFRRTPSLLLVFQNSSSELVDGGGVAVATDVRGLVAAVSDVDGLAVAVDA